MMSRRRTASLVFAACLCSMQPLLICRRALAHPSNEDSSRPPVSWRVQVEIVSKTARGDFEAVLREWFQINAVEADIHRSANLNPRDVLSEVPDDDLLRVWVTFPKADQATIYFVEPGSQRFLLRDVSLRADFDEIAREQLVQVIVTSAAAFMQRRASTSKEDFTRALHSSPQAQVDVVPARVERLPKPNPHTAPFPTTLRAGGFYSFALEQSHTVTHGPGVLLGVVQNRDRFRIFADLEAQYLLPHTVRTAEVDIALRGFALRGFIGIEHRWAEALAVGMQVGGGGDRMSFEPLAVNGTGVDAQASATHFRPVLVLDLRGVIDLASTRLALVVGSATYLKTTQYLVLRDSVPHVVYQPLLLEPHGAIEITWN